MGYAGNLFFNYRIITPGGPCATANKYKIAEGASSAAVYARVVQHMEIRSMEVEEVTSVNGTDPPGNGSSVG